MSTARSRSLGLCSRLHAFGVVLVLAMLLGLTSGASVDERNSLVNLYQATGGPNWINKQNWLVGDPCSNLWFGVNCTDDQVLKITLKSNNLVGTLVDLKMPTLRNFAVDGNSLRGTIPPWTALVNLQYLYLQYNQLTGSIPEWDVGPRLGQIYAYENQLTGAIPQWRAQYRLSWIHLRGNRLTGTLPDFLAQPHMTFLKVSNNPISGSIPSWSHFYNLQTLELYGTNLCGGSLPATRYASGTNTLTDIKFKCTTVPSWCSGCLCDPNMLPCNRFQNSLLGKFLQMRRTDITRLNNEHPVVARSYDGNPWEAVPNEDLTPINTQCSGSQCDILSGGSYQVEEVVVPSTLASPSSDAKWSRFLLQSTFGATKAGLAAAKTTYVNNFSQWVADQMALPATSHRAHLRQRMSPRRGDINRIGNMTVPCEIGSRYHRHALNPQDEGKLIVISKSGSVLRLTIDSNIRTEVPQFAGFSSSSSDLPKTYKICTVKDYVNGDVFLEINPESTSCKTRGSNPAIAFASTNSANTKTLSNSQVTFTQVPGVTGALVMKTISTTCNIPSNNAFIKYQNGTNVEYYRFDPRLKLVRNTTTDPFPQPDRRNGGSPGEVENIPELGERYRIRDQRTDDRLRSDVERYDYGGVKINVWTDIIRTKPDQLRQRAAWALSQIFPMSELGIAGGDASETWLNYYDIFVRNVFGNFRDVLREVSYSVPMSQYLSFYQNKGRMNKDFADENYAREVMQLFSIGLWKLNDNGTRQMDDQGHPIPTYTNDDIVDFARLWTGFTNDTYRPNIESFIYNALENGVDPSVINTDWKDPMPKAKLDAGYLGDHYPLCNELPARHWLQQGATYLYTGVVSDASALIDAENPSEAGYVGRFAPTRSSPLYQALCAEDNTGRCTFPAKVKLPSTLTCNGVVECGMMEMSTVKMIDAIAGVTRFYTYRAVPCVKLALFQGGKVASYSNERRQCSPPDQVVGSPRCCLASNRGSTVNNIARSICMTTDEYVDYATNQARCRSLSYEVCTGADDGLWTNSCAPRRFNWLDISCSLKVEVYPTGQISVVDPISGDLTWFIARTLQPNSTISFRVRWENGVYPKASSGCAAGCTVVQDRCMCDFSITSAAVYTDRNNLPTKSNLLARLSQGAVAPSLYGRTYALCGSACGTTPGYKVWTSPAGVLNEVTIFEVEPSLAGDSNIFLFNKESMASIGSYLFRNPPRFMRGAGDIRVGVTNALEVPAAINEVEAMLDHLFKHPSTAPFIVYRLIQRLVTSNPSPRYMQAAVTAFRTGTYNGKTYSGRYGDLGATVAAILLDREARSSILEVDPTFGVMREPIVKLMQILRAFEYETLDRQELSMAGLETTLGQQPYRQTSVFGFYLPENRPEGPVNDLGLVSPETQLMITPLLVNTMNAFVSLIDDEFTPCSFGYWSGSYDCGSSYATAVARYTPTSSTPEAVVNELDLLLTGQRLNPASKAYITEAYRTTLAASGTKAALKKAQKLVVLSPEFTVTNVVQDEVKEERQVKPEVPSQNRRYKAIVVMVLAGGADSYNHLVPHSNCNNGQDLYQQYATVRGKAAIPKGNLLPINVPANTQPCRTFGVHPALNSVRNLYNDNNVIFFANTGSLVQPITVDEYNARPRVKQVPPALFAHDIMTVNTQSLQPQNSSATGVLGRAVDAQRNQPNPFRSSLYSITGKVKLLDGAEPTFIGSNGVTQFKQFSQMREDIANMTGLVSDSPFGENYLSTLVDSINKTERLGSLLQGITTNTSFPSGTGQLEQVSRLMKLRQSLHAERDVFVVRFGGYDTHNTFNLDGVLAPVDNSLDAFAKEMKAQGIWNDVAFLTISEFGRTITSNDQGTDHGWGGHYFLAGGGVKGGKILGQYPDLSETSPYRLGRVMIPSTGFDAVWNGVMQWFDVSPTDINTVLPNLSLYPSGSLFSRNDLFK